MSFQLQASDQADLPGLEGLGNRLLLRKGGALKAPCPGSLHTGWEEAMALFLIYHSRIGAFEFQEAKLDGRWSLQSYQYREERL